MAGAPQLPAYIKLVYKDDPGALEKFVSDVGGAGKRAQSAMQQAMSGVRDTVAQALTVPRNAFGSLDVGVDQLRKMETQLEATATASREVQRALVAEARATEGLTQGKASAIRAAGQFARATEAELSALRQNIAFNERLQAELNKTASATNAVVNATNRGTTAFGQTGESMRGTRQAFVQTGQQLQDLGISLYSGQRASTVFAQQLPQLAFALTSLEGSTNKTQNAIGKFAAVLSGPLGSIALVAASVGLGILVEKLFFAEKATDKLKDKSLSLREALDSVNIGTKEATKAIQDYNNAQEAARKSSALEKEELIKKAAARAEDTIKIRENIVARIEALQLADRELRKTGDRGAFGFGADADALGGNLTKAKKDVSDAQQALRNLRIERAEIGADLANDPIAKINDQYDRMADAAKKAARGNDQLTASLEKTLSSLGKRKKADLDAENKKTRSERPSTAADLVKFAGLSDIVQGYRNVSSGLGRRTAPTKGASTVHGGLDIPAPLGTSVRAPYLGTVELVGQDKGSGKYIVIDHGAGTKTRFKHLSDNSFVKPGDAVAKGDLIGKVGSTGVSTGNHLHYEAILNGKFNNAGKLIAGKYTDPRGKLPVGDADVSADTERRLEAQRKAAESFANELQKIDQITQRISSEFDDQPKLIDRITINTLRLKQATADIDRDLADANTTAEQRIELEARKLEIIKSQALVSGFVQKQLQNETDDFNQRIQIQKLILSGREEEAKILERITQKSKEYGLDTTLETQQEILKVARETLTTEDATTQEKTDAKAVIEATLPAYQKALALRAQITGEVTRQVEIETQLEQIGQRILRQRQAYASYIDSTYSSLENLLSGGKAKDFFKELSGGFKQLKGTLRTDKLFGGAFDELRRFNNRRSPENIAISNYVEQVDKGSIAILSHADALVNATVRINGAANDNTAIGSAASTAALAAARVSGGGITVDSNKSAPIRLANESVTDFVTRLSSAIVIPFTTELDKVFGTKFFGGLSGVLSGALSGFARAGKVGAVLGAGQKLFGDLTSGGFIKEKLGSDISAAFGTALKGAETGNAIAGVFKSIGIKSSRTGGQIGGAAGGLIGSAFGPGGALVGEFLGGTIGSIVGGLFKKTKKADLTVTNSSVSATGTKSLLGGLNSGGGGIQDRIKAIAQQLNGSVGDFSLAIKQKGKKFLFGGKKFDDFESAAEAALLSAIQNGAVKGISAGAQKLLKAGTDLDRQLQKALSFQGVFDRLKEIDDPVGAALDRLDREFTNLKSIFAEAGASASEYADLQRLYDMDRAKAIEEANSRITASLKSLYADLTINNDALSLRDRQSAAKAVYDPLAARVAAGDKTAYDAYADAAKSLLDIERQIFGSQSGYFDRLSEVTNLTKARIDEESNVTSIDRLGLTFTDAISTQTNALLAGLQPALLALNTNIGTLIEQGFGAGRPLSDYQAARSF